jgi:hypothetical protein
MAKVTKNIGRVPVSRFEYIDGETYYSGNIVTRYGSAFQCVVESTTTPPATLDASGKVKLSEGWIFFADTSAISNAVAEHTEKITKIEQLLQEGYTFRGVATPETNPGTPDQKVFYIAKGKGVYANFGGINVDEDEVVLLTFDDTWGKLLSDIASNSKLTEVELDGSHIIKLITAALEVEASVNLLNSQTLKRGYISVNGDICESTSLSYSDYIDVESAQVVYTYTKIGGFRTFAARFITAYDKNKNVLPDNGLNNTTDAVVYNVPKGVKYIVVSVPDVYFANGNGALSTQPLTSFVDYVLPHYIATKEFIKKAINTPDFSRNSLSVSGDLSNGEILSLPRINVNKSIIMAFTCDIKSFNIIEFGKRNVAQTLGRWWRLTSSTIEFWNGGRYLDYTSDLFKTPFMPSNNLQIIVHKSVSCNADNPTLNAKTSLTIISNGNVWELKNAFDYPENDVEMFVKSVDSTLTGCSLAAQPMDIGKNIWLFGDSYMSWDVKRWVYYLASFGYADNCLINAYAGQTTIDQIPVLDTLLKIGLPKYIVWCLGMNDGADYSSPSSNWMDGVNHVLEVCNKYGIIPIFATIPTVPTINHEEKNLWVRNSGYRYIDFAKAVGSKANGDWYSGMLDDGVHPTETGARALYVEAMSDFPEFAMK